MLIADTKYPLHTRMISLAEGLSVACTDEGHGYPLLFIHGLGSYIPAWAKNIPFLSNYYRCIAIDLPGYGKSSKAGFKPSMHFYADVVEALLDKLQIDSCYLAGHSMGGQVAMHAALRFPERIQKLVLVAPAGLEIFEPAEAQQLKSWFETEKVYAAGEEIISRNVKANFYHFPADAQPLLTDRLAYTSCTDYYPFCETISKSVSAMLGEPVYEKLTHLSMPVLLLFGRQDAYIPSPLLHPNLSVEQLAREAAAKMPQATFRLLDHCGHFLQWEQAELFNERVREFLGD
ncbi:alpha/beta fold hydrolase [Nafulsella turpanensis]|uniref:alpha/beta fold hydrolase n=1 Tax=Nafulsella turpanensis TaxID=1265690 RepID=UPI000349575D|nr:alpha/beta fold hydrolase [Nafulsella turpanensis]